VDAFEVNSVSVTMTDVAKRAGVSPATVSRVLNGNANVAEPTRKKVLKAVEELKYQPNLLASALVTKKTKALGLVLPDVSNPFFAEVVRAVEREATGLGYSVLVCNTDDRPEVEERYLSDLRQRGVDGIVAAPSLEGTSAMERVLEAGYPICFFARDVPTLAVTCVKVDDFRGGYLAARHLIELGHRRIAMVSEPRTVPSVADRVRGYRHALQEAGIEGETILTTEETSIRAGIVVAEGLLGPNRPTAVFCANDVLAIGVMHRLRREGLETPRDVSLVGFDGTVLASVVDPTLTTIAQPIDQMARAAVEALVAEIDGVRDGTQRIVFQPVLREGRSTGPAPG